MNLASSIAKRTGNLCDTGNGGKITGSKRADYLQEQVSQILSSVRIQAEYAAAKVGLS